MRHSWHVISANVSICRQCGMKRVENKQRFHGSSRPVMTYTRDDMMQTSAGPCCDEWPDWINPEWRVIIYQQPAQERLSLDDEPKTAPRKAPITIDHEPAPLRNPDMNDDIPF